MTHKCVNCSKTFKLKHNYNKHILLCDILYESTETNDKEFTNKKLFDIVVKLTTKCNKMESKIQKLEKLLIKEIKKINIIDYLNEHFPPKHSNKKIENFTDNIKNIEITDEYVDIVYKNGCQNGIYMILQKLYPLTTNIHHNFKYFTSKSKQFYVYDDNKWNIDLNNENIYKLICKIHSKLLRKYFKWKQTINTDNDTSYQDKFNILTQFDRDRDILCLKISKLFSNYINMNLNNISEYKFTF
jgi:hypothetical protein